MNTADKLAEQSYYLAIEHGLNKEQAQMLANAAHDITLNGEQTEQQLLSQFY